MGGKRLTRNAAAVKIRLPTAIPIIAICRSNFDRIAQIVVGLRVYTELIIVDLCIRSSRQFYHRLIWIKTRRQIHTCRGICKKLGVVVGCEENWQRIMPRRLQIIDTKSVPERLI